MDLRCSVNEVDRLREVNHLCLVKEVDIRHEVIPCLVHHDVPEVFRPERWTTAMRTGTCKSHRWILTVEDVVAHRR
jgi:hypothetical protein